MCLTKSSGVRNHLQVLSAKNAVLKGSASRLLTSRPLGMLFVCAYKLAGCVVADGGGVAAGFFIAGQVIAAYGYRVGGVYKVQFIRQPLKMDDLAHVLGLLVNDMERTAV